jgi:hypothetical protein
MLLHRLPALHIDSWRVPVAMIGSSDLQTPGPTIVRVLVAGAFLRHLRSQVCDNLICIHVS